MSPEIIQRKIAKIRTLLKELEPFENLTFKEFQRPQNHYAVERILQLLVEVSSDILQHIFKTKNEDYPLTYRTVFLRAGEMGILSKDLSLKLAQAAGMRNILVHLYETINDLLVFNSVKTLRKDFTQFVKEIEKEMSD